MKSLADRPLRVAGEPYGRHLWRMVRWLAELRLVPYVGEASHNPLPRIYRALWHDGLTRSGKVLALALVLMTLLGFRNAQSFPLTSAAVALALLVWARLAGLLQRCRIQGELRAPEVATVGEPAHYQVTLSNPGRRTWRDFVVRPLAVRDMRLPPETRRPLCAALPPGASWQGRAEWVPRRRGLQQLDGVVIESYFPFFLTRTAYYLEQAETLPVLPEPLRVSLPSLRLLATQASSGVDFGSRAGGRERILQYIYSRPFQTGDSLRRLDQRASARRGEPLTRVYDGSEALKPAGLALLVDCSQRDFPAWQPRPTDGRVLDRRLALAVEVTRRAAGEGLVLSAVAWNGQWKHYPPQGSSFYRDLAVCQASHAPGYPQQLLTPDQIYVLLTGCWNEALQARVAAWRGEGFLVLVCFLPDGTSASAQEVANFTHEPGYLLVEEGA